MAAYRTALDRDKSRADAYARLAILHDKQGKFRESADLYRKALALRPGDPDIFCDMGYSFYLQRRWAEAEMNLRQSLAVNPEHRRAHNNLALLLVRDNRLGDALAEFGKAGSDPVQAHMNLAFALTIDQRWESARAEYQCALALDPSSQLAKARLDELNNLLAKREPAAPAPDGARRDPPLLTAATATAAPTARRGPDGPTAAAPPRPHRNPPRPAPGATRRCSRPRRSPPPLRRGTGPGRESPSRPCRPRTAPCSGSGRPPTRPAAPRRRPGPTPAPATPPRRPRPSDETPTRNPRRFPDDTSTLPLLAIDSPTAAQAETRSPDRASIPPPQSFEALRTARPDAHPPAVSTPIAPPRRTPTPRTATPGGPRLRTRTRSPWIRPGIHQRPLMGRATPMIGARSSQSSRGRRFRIGCAELRKRRSRPGFEPFPLCAREPAFLPKATGTSKSRSRLLTELFDSRPYISATDTPGVALAPVTCGLPFAITARCPTERFKEDGMMLKKVNRIPPNYSAPSLQSMQGTICSFA